ncbi:MAG TPA: amino acid permease [Chthoniobacterales bacterium]|nr:amino acid permease [Chthoniobacterales bacterium]
MNLRGSPATSSPVQRRVSSPPLRTISVFTATCIVVANMVGTGIFTSLGFQVGDLPSGFAIMALWAVGGLCALCGALSYAELAAALPRSGGEYHFLREIYHPAVGFVAGWISATVGFAAPVAIAAIPFGVYLAGVAPMLNPLALSLGVVCLTTLVLLWDFRLGSGFQNAATILKITLIGILIAAGFLVAKTQPVSFFPSAAGGKLIVSTPFAIALYWVMYSYSGWNASTYIVGEVRRPARAIPLSVGLGTLLVTALYLALNAVFLRTTPRAELIGKQEVGLIAGVHIFGPAGGKVMAVLIAVGLVATVSAMMWIGPRVTVAMGEDLRLLAPLARRNRRGLPVRATLLQFAIVLLLILVTTFQKVVNYVQFTLTLSSTLTVLGVFVLRWRRPDLPRPYRTWGYPVTPAIFLVISGWMLWHLLADPITREASLWGLATALAGLLIYFLSPKEETALEPRNLR